MPRPFGPRKFIIRLMNENASENASLFGTFLYQPQGVTFEDQLAGEKIILLLRAHLVTLVPSILMTIFLALAPFLYVLVPVFLKINFFPFLTAHHAIFIIIFWYLIVFGIVFNRFISWYFNIYILTDERIIDVNFKGLLSRDVSHAKLDRIQDVSPRLVGFFRTFFNFGDVYIQTAGELPEFHFNQVVKPEIVAKEILDQASKKEGESHGGVY